MPKNIVEYLTTREAAAYLGVSRQWLDIGRTKGYGPPFIKAGDGGGGRSRFRITSEGVSRFLFFGNFEPLASRGVVNSGPGW